MSRYSYSFVNSIEEIGADAWNACAGIKSPFTRYEFLHALEATGCTTAATGWQPHHAAVRLAETGALVAVVPVYLKTNSYGEYVFDWSWANAYQGNGLNYYPKLLTAVPFTPSVGSRILLHDLAQLEAVAQSFVPALQAEVRRLKASSYHLLFPNPAERAAFESSEMVERMGSQFHWHNRDYKTNR